MLITTTEIKPSQLPSLSRLLGVLTAMRVVINTGSHSVVQVDLNLKSELKAILLLQFADLSDTPLQPRATIGSHPPFFLALD